LVLVVTAAGVCFQYRYRIWRNSISQLEDLQLGKRVILTGTVTAVDLDGRRFWLQDATGALPIHLTSADPIEPGDTVVVEATKATHYDASIGRSSIRLSNVFFQVLQKHAQLPPPLSVTLGTFPQQDKEGTRVRFEGIIHEVSYDRAGRLHMQIGDPGHDDEVVIPNGSVQAEQLRNTRVEITGVAEPVRNARGAIVRYRIWANASRDVQIKDAAPAQPPIYSIRQIYNNPQARDGHALRLRAVVTRQPSPTSLLVQDEWGEMECDLSYEQGVPLGTSVEVSGFPLVDGLRILLTDAKVIEQSRVLVERVPARPAGGEIRKIAEIRHLDVQQASNALPVRIHGMVTYSDPQWDHLYIQDSTGGIYVKTAGHHPELHPGERVTLVGLTNAGDYAPVIVAPRFGTSGGAFRAVPMGLTAMKAASGAGDAQYVSLKGIVHPIRIGEETQHPLMTFELYTNVGQIHVYTSPFFTQLDKLRVLEDAEVQIRGVFGTVFNSRRQLIGYQLLVPLPSDIKVIEPALRDPFDAPVKQIGELLRYSTQAGYGHRVKVKGCVTLVRKDFFYVQDDTGGVEVRGNTGTLRTGDVVEALGFPSLVGRYSPILTDASFRQLPEKVVAFPKPTDAESMLRGSFDSQLVSVQGKLLALLNTPQEKSLLLESGGHTFTAVLDSASIEGQQWRTKEGSLLQLTGICSDQVDPNKLYLLLEQQPAGFKVLLRSPSDVTVVRAAPFWTSRNIVLVLLVSLAGCFTALVWISVLRNRVWAQKLELQKAAETSNAMRDLSEAMWEVSTRQSFDAEVLVRGSEEVAQLVVGFNGMLSELRKAEESKQQFEQKLKEQAVTDELTRLPNRRLLSDRLGQSVAMAKRDGSKVAVLYLDLDGFKLVNDSLGHATGDALLIEVAERLRSQVREADTLARIGGDEFAIVLNRVRTQDDAQKVARALLDTLACSYTIDGHYIRITGSIGISIFVNDGSSEDDLLQQADSAMYKAKKSGKNRVEFFTNDLSALVREQMTLQNELRRALENDAIEVHYQPEFCLATRRLVRFEALARWTHPNLGSIPPMKFIPIAEESGLINDLGRCVMRKACEDAVNWQQISSTAIQVAVNVSNLQFARESFVDEVVEILQATGLNPTLLQIELTESAMLDRIDQAARSITQLREMGVGVAIDDFGTGYSCLSYLPRLSLDALKIDRSFINDLTTRSDIRGMVRSLIAMAQELGIRVIAEGIETEEQLEMIEDMGGDEVQGYLLGRPTSEPAQVIRLHLEQHRQVANTR
jgi:diguanylate cyclase (GGDEF)-like protein